MLFLLGLFALLLLLLFLALAFLLVLLQDSQSFLHRAYACKTIAHPITYRWKVFEGSKFLWQEVYSSTLKGQVLKICKLFSKAKATLSTGIVHLSAAAFAAF